MRYRGWLVLLAPIVGLIGQRALVLPPAQACGIGQSFTMVANSTRALAFPIASATPDHPLGVFPDDAIVGQPVAFTEDVSGAPPGFDPSAYVWVWSFGDGAAADGFAASHTYARPGTVVVSLEIYSQSNPAQRTDPFDSAQLTIAAQAFADPPIVHATASATYVAAGGTVTYDATGSSALVGGSLRYLWNFGDGSTTTGQHVVHRFMLLGSGNVALIVQDERGAQSFALLPVKIVPQLPHAGIALATQTPHAGAPITLKATAPTVPASPGNHIVDYLWDFGDGTQWEGLQPQTTHIYARPGSYQVTLQVTDAQGLPGTTQLTITVGSPLMPARPTPVALWLILPLVLLSGGLAWWGYGRRGKREKSGLRFSR
jgi:PKD repeat protein